MHFLRLGGGGWEERDVFGSWEGRGRRWGDGAREGGGRGYRAPASSAQNTNVFLLSERNSSSPPGSARWRCRGLVSPDPTHTQRAEGVLACSVVSGEASEAFTAPGHRSPPPPPPLNTLQRWLLLPRVRAQTPGLMWGPGRNGKWLVPLDPRGQGLCHLYQLLGAPCPLPSPLHVLPLETAMESDSFKMETRKKR